MRLVCRLVSGFKKRGALGFLWAGLADVMEASATKIRYIRDHYTRYNFVDRALGSDTLIIILVGYKDYLWPSTLERVFNYNAVGADVCLVSSGVYSHDLDVVSQRNGWSYLYVKRNSPGVALNKAISLHPGADFIYKIDEDIFISSGFFEGLRAGYEHAWNNSGLEPGFVAPIININGISYRCFLEELGLDKDYRRDFGEMIERCEGVPIHSDPKACWWVWKNSLPLDDVAERFKRKDNDFTILGSRFSIGAILFRRSFIEGVGGFKSAWHSAVLGVDENELCKDCVSYSRPMFLIKNVFAGHFSFYLQEKGMVSKIPAMKELDPSLFLK